MSEMIVKNAGIKMRKNTKEDSTCVCCGKKIAAVLDMYDLKIGKITLTLCDVCNEILLKKTLRASCLTNERVKSTKDINIIKLRARKANGYEDKVHNITK